MINIKRPIMCLEIKMESYIRGQMEKGVLGW